MPRKVKTVPQFKTGNQSHQDEKWQEVRDGSLFKKSIQVKAKSKGQQNYISTVESSLLTFCLGESGSGKTHIALALALQELYKGNVEKIVCIRSAIESSSRSLGHLPGDLAEKLANYMAVFDCIGIKLVGESEWKKLLTDGKVVYMAVGFLRGMNLDSCFLVCDESQNLTLPEITTVVTRLGENSRGIICGDAKQCDLEKRHNDNAFETVIEKLHKRPIDGVNCCYLSEEDICRSYLVREFVKLFGE